MRIMAKEVIYLILFLIDIVEMCSIKVGACKYSRKRFFFFKYIAHIKLQNKHIERKNTNTLIAMIANLN